MDSTRAGCSALTSSAWLCATSLACGDIGDAQVPLPLHSSTREPVAEFERPSTDSAESLPRAVLRVAVGPAAGGACPIEFEALLPDASARETLLTGMGERAIDGDVAEVTCSVRASSGQADGFDIELSLQHERLPLFFATGQIEAPGSASAGGVVAIVELQLSAPDASQISAACRVEVQEVLSGAVWFHSIACETRASDARAEACDVAISAIFENCRR